MSSRAITLKQKYSLMTKECLISRLMSIMIINFALVMFSIFIGTFWIMEKIQNERLTEAYESTLELNFIREHFTINDTCKHFNP